MLSITSTVLLSLLPTISLSSTTKQPNLLAGTWNLKSVTATFPNGTTVEPVGPSPYGRLIFTPDGYYAQQLNTADYAQNAWPDLMGFYTPGTDEENANVVRSSFGVSGVYRVDEEGEYTGLTTGGCIIPNFIGLELGPPTQNFESVQDGEGLVERIAMEGAPVTEFVWERLEEF